MSGDVEIKCLNGEEIFVGFNFEQPCEICYGEKRRCDFRCKCKGSGKVPTELGKKVLSLIQNNLKVDILGGVSV